MRDRLLEPDVRLLTLTGASGTGKTRLALAVADSLLARWGGWVGSARAGVGGKRKGEAKASVRKQ